MDDFTADLAPLPAAPRNELGEFLRSRRSHLRPQDVGLPEGSGRRLLSFFVRPHAST